MSFETPPRPRWLLRVSLALGTVLVLVLGVVAVVGFVQRCGTDVWHAGDDRECVGVTDGSFPFSPELADVEGKILAENRKAADAPQYVTVAVLMPMTAEPDDSLSTSQIREYLQGAYIAQQVANRDAHGLKIQLALANEGRGEHAWDQVTDQLLDMVDVPGEVDAQANLVAVTGLGVSTTETVKGVRKLGDAGVPMVGYLSADGFNNTSEAFGDPLRNLTRVSPSLANEVATLTAYLDKTGTRPSRALLVRDDNDNDYYTGDLRTNFEEQFQAGSADELAVSPYTGGQDPYNLNTKFDRIAGRLCEDDELNTVLYAGRSNLLPDFVEQISKRTCPKDKEITVLTGSESTDLPKPPPNAPTAVSVLYASVSDPAALGHPDNRFQSQYLDFTDALRQRFGDGVDESNWTVMGHDVTLTSITAAKLSVEQDDFVPSATDVRDSLMGLNYPRNDVTGASGRFHLNDSGDRVSGTIPVLRRDKTGHVEVLDLGGLDG
ncbi:hypothetical protein OOZ19_17145 [Saccharopolyspora sp. NFXS83]|uniref:hypothetical protein n=1 Tax=Saccharopolyspora sp. NFXS83 TaxID=2993560 RepID=UPI00224B857A|nr:hypothetical protein [Saccharopolyspora sp. NFXS83]MCX2731971.1 hypothetical protein [Saccharopolyspora sp. NFXS83]